MYTNTTYYACVVTAEDIGPHISQFPRTVKKRFYLFIYLFMHGQGHKSNERPRRAFVERDGRRCQVGHSRQVNSRAFFLLLASFACLLWLRREQKKKKKKKRTAQPRATSTSTRPPPPLSQSRTYAMPARIKPSCPLANGGR